MNIQRKNSAHHFCMQSEREQTLDPSQVQLSGSILWGVHISQVVRVGYQIVWLSIVCQRNAS